MSNKVKKFIDTMIGFGWDLDSINSGFYCFYCGEVLQKNYRFCSHCGKKTSPAETVEEEVGNAFSYAEENPQISTGVAVADFLEKVYAWSIFASPKTIFCSCGQKVSTRFCPHCGKPNAYSNQDEKRELEQACG